MGFVIEKHEISDLDYLTIFNDEFKIGLLAYRKAIEISKHPVGYGCYNPHVVKEEFKYYIEWQRNDCCD